MQPPEHPQTQRGLIPRGGFILGQRPQLLVLGLPPNTGRGSGFVLMSPGGMCPCPVGTPKPSPDSPFQEPGSHMGCGCPLASPPGNGIRSPFPISSLAQPQAPAGWAQREAAHSLPAGILNANFRCQRDTGSRLPGAGWHWRRCCSQECPSHGRTSFLCWLKVSYDHQIPKPRPSSGRCWALVWNAAGPGPLSWMLG